MRTEVSRSRDVFISYSAHDKQWADVALAALESRNIRCWIAPRDITAGAEWGAAIIEGIDGSRVMVLIFSRHANDSAQVRREVERAVSKGLTIIPLRVADVRPVGAMEYALSNTQWLDAFTPPVEQTLDQLTRAVQALVTKPPSDEPGNSDLQPVAPGRSRPRVRVAFVWSALIGVLVFGAVLAGVLYPRKPPPTVEAQATDDKATKPSSQPPPAPEFAPLFNGNDLTGWELLGSESASWKVVNKALVGTSTEPSVLKTTKSDFKNFHLRLVLMKAEGSGECRVQLFTVPNTTDDGGYRVTLGSLGGDRDKIGQLYFGAKTGNVFSPLLTSVRVDDKTWLKLEISRLEGKRLTVKVNDLPTADADETQSKAARKTEGRNTDIRISISNSLVRVKSIEIKELP